MIVSPTDPALVAAQLASRHVRAAKTLARTNAFDFASFHLLCALEEFLKSRLFYADREALVGPTGSVVEIESKIVNRAMFDHQFKIGFGLLFLLIQTPFLAGPRSRKGALKVKAKLLDDVKWLGELLDRAPGLREQAIYSGADRRGSPPAEVDWEQFVKRVLPIAETQAAFAAWIVTQRATADDRARLAAAVSEFRKEVQTDLGGEKPL